MKPPTTPNHLIAVTSVLTPLLATTLAVAVVVVMDVFAVAVAAEFSPVDDDNEEGEEVPSAPKLTLTPTLPQSCRENASTSEPP